jgi:uncharacterized protein (TIGR01777 family)
MKILVSGASGLIGSVLLPCLSSRGHHAIPLVRTRAAAGQNDVCWDPRAGRLDAEDIEGFDAVVHLAGENIAGGRWTAGRKQRILESRAGGTRLLASTLSRLGRPPGVLVSASAIGYYGDRGEEVLVEESAPGRGFLPEVCAAWEEATSPAWERGIRVVILRIGIVLSKAGGALARMLLPFRMGIGGKIGSGDQYMSWISIDDLIGVICRSLEDDTLSGTINAVAPNPTTNGEFVRVLGRVLARPTIVPLPSFAARLLLGQMANELLLAGARVSPARLIAAGYQFQYPDLETALRHILART